MVQKQVDQLDLYDIFNYYELEYYRTMVQYDETILQLRAGTGEDIKNRILTQVSYKPGLIVCTENLYKKILNVGMILILQFISVYYL